ncbi:nuclear transport factor 2 family protein [Sphingomonas jatrophae]|uniref:SnoaL-like domain-containing protein n=1 Tax=Sphingomonas jatrophae TaxID=1166337 RepID=A0A1I6KKE4_9SPHN|nr:nuclear transport factor 2 family protein [Sphingomonas jatrophae]SFR91671.1 SnoaL-like domain-containing protein [Sphingomonas jatrophae]
MQELLDRIALADLVALYCRGCDRRDFALVRSLYHDDAIDDHGAMFRGGPDEFVAWLPTAMAPWELTVHSITNSLFAIQGDKAEGEHHVRAYHRTHGERRREYVVHGRYLDRYERRDGKWKFIHRSLVFDSGDIVDIDEDRYAQISKDAAPGTADERDPSWGLKMLAARRG